MHETMIEVYNDFVGFISRYLISGIFISVLVLWVATFIKKLDVQHAKSILRWIMIGYACLAVVNLIVLVINEFFSGVEFAGYSIGERAFGDYWFSFWFILICNLVVPLILFSKWISNKIIFLFLVAMMMNIGWLFESFVIHLSNIHRDYLPGDYEMKGPNPFLPYEYELKFLLSGLILGIIVLGIGQSLIRNEESGPIDKAFRL